MESCYVGNGYEVGTFVEIGDCWDLRWYISIGKNRRLSVVCTCGSCVSGSLCVKGCTPFAHLPSGLLEVAWVRAKIQDEHTGIVFSIALVAFLCVLLHTCAFVCVGWVVHFSALCLHLHECCVFLG